MALPVVSSDQTIGAFMRAGWTVDRNKGSHTTLIKPGSAVVLTVMRRKEMPRGTLRALIRDARMSVEEFVALVR